MAQQVPGKSHRKGITLAQLIKMYPDDASAEKAFVARRWPKGIACPHCGDMDIQQRTTHPEMPYRCRGCKKFFSVKTGTVMQGSKIGYQAWLIAMYSLLTNLKGTSSMKLHRDLGITQKSAWHLAHRIREAWADKQAPFAGPVEVDETFVGGLEGNKHGNKKIKEGRGTVGKAAVAGVRDRATGKVVAQKETLQGFVHASAADGATVYCGGTSRSLSGGTTGARSIRTIKWARSLVGMERKRLRYAELVAPNGMESGARPRK